MMMKDQMRLVCSMLGKFCHQLLNNASRWKKGTTLVDVVRVLVKYMNEPDPDYAVNFGRDFLLFNGHN